MLVKNCHIHDTQNKNVSERFTKEFYDQGRLMKSVITTEYDYVPEPPMLPEIDAS